MALTPPAVGKACAQHPFNLTDDIRRGPVHLGNTLRYVSLLLRRQRSKDRSGLIGIKISHDQSNGLWMLVLDKVHELGRIRLAQEVERTNLQARRQAIDDIHRLVGTQGLLEHALRILKTTRRDIILRHSHLVELADNL